LDASSFFNGLGVLQKHSSVATSQSMLSCCILFLILKKASSVFSYSPECNIQNSANHVYIIKWQSQLID